MKIKIISTILSILVVANLFPATVSADEVSIYDFTAPSTSGYDFVAPSTSGYNFTAPTVSAYDYNAPVTSAYNYTAPTVSGYNYTSQSASAYNYVAPTVSGYDFTSPSVSAYNYTAPTVSGYNYTAPTVSAYDYSAPASSAYNYTAPTVSGYNYTAPTVSGYNYNAPAVSAYDFTAPSTSGYNYTAPTVSGYDYVAPTASGYNYVAPTASGYNYVAPTASGYNYVDNSGTPPTVTPYNPGTAPTVTPYNPGTSPTVSPYNYTTQTYTTQTYTTQPYTTSGGNIGTTYGTGVTYGNTGSYGNVGSYGGTGYSSVGYLPTGSGIPNVTTVINCPSGSTLTNGQCINVITGNVVTTTVCPSGTTLNGTTCVNTVTGNVITNTTCPNGSVLQNGQCVTTNTTCPVNTQLINGVCQQINTNPGITYQSCWDGSVIPTTSVCSSQYKICANGTSVPVNQTCYYNPNPVYVAPPVVKFNNVVTSVATQITNTSGRCNGIGLIANNAESTGWFEYGETSNLGRTTAQARIGSANTAPFSNVLANLKPSTRYYCRAVMQNQYGLVKGEIVSFTTKAKATTYVKPVATPKKTTSTPKKNTITCSDGSVVSVKNQTAATLINQGEKLITLQVEKTEGKLSSGETVKYKIVYKNLTESRLTGVVVQVKLPQEITFVSTSVGTFDESSNTLTLNQDTLDPYAEGTILVTGKVITNAPVGKSIVTNVYTIYTVPGTQTQDEVTAYVVGSIVPQTDIAKQDTGAKKVVGAGDGRGFMPNSLIEWLALLAILFIIFILGRSIYASYKEDEGAHH